MSGYTARQLQDALGLSLTGAELQRRDLQVLEQQASLMQMVDAGKSMRDLIEPEWLRALRSIDEDPLGGTLSRVAAERLAIGNDFSNAASRLIETMNFGSEARRLAGELAGDGAMAKLALDATDRYATLGAMAGGYRELEATIARIAEQDALTRSVGEVFSRAIRIEQPWIDLIEPEKSFAALGLMHEIGQTLASSDLFGAEATARLTALLGTWDPADDMDFQAHTQEERSEIIVAEGFDDRLLDIPVPAYPQALWATGNGPRPREFRERADSALFVVRMPRSEAELAFSCVRYVERALRRVVSEQLHSASGERWVETRVPKPMRERWEETRVKRGASPAADIIRFSELGDLQQLILQHWKSCFAQRFKVGPGEFRVWTSQLIVIRHPTMHSDDVGSAELVCCLADGSRLLQALELRFPWQIEGVN